MSEFEAIVVGGGIVGACTAAMLAELGVDVVLLDSAVCAGRGASAYSGGIVRLYDADPVMMELGGLALQARRARRFGRVFDTAIRRTGVLYRAAEGEAEAIRNAMETLGDEASPWSFLSRAQLARLTDFVLPQREKLDFFEREGGHSNVRFATHAMAHLVRETAPVLEHMEVARLSRSDCGLNEVHLSGGAILRSRVVVVAAGAWTGRLIDHLPVEARSIPLALIEMNGAPSLPVIDIPAGTYAVPFGSTLLGVGCGHRTAGPTPDELTGNNELHHADCLKQLAALTGRQRPSTTLSIFNGFDSYTPDNRPLVGFVDEDECVYAITGLAGLGFKIAPAIAELAAQRIRARLRGVGPAPMKLAEAFHPRRFADSPVRLVSRRTS